MKASIRLGKIAGVDIGIHYSWFAVLVLVSWSLAEGFLPNRYPGWSTGVYWATGFFAALLLFVSVLVHELAHSLVARARGVPVEGITLFLLGGVSNLRADARRAVDEFVISVVGPLTSFVLAGIFWAGAVALRHSETPAAAVVWYLALINLILALFNLLPAFPLDGGRPQWSDHRARDDGPGRPPDTDGQHSGGSLVRADRVVSPRRGDQRTP